MRREVTWQSRSSHTFVRLILSCIIVERTLSPQQRIVRTARNLLEHAQCKFGSFPDRYVSVLRCINKRLFRGIGILPQQTEGQR